jgi:methylenetetrahydrofolate dehydrogenase (NADP+)/methenyltetrahydrofolate cyclohydrolase
MDTDFIVNAIPLEKDADVLSQLAYEAFEKSVQPSLLPPVVGAIKEVFDRHAIDPTGKQTVIVGNGKLVGLPASVWLQSLGADVIVLTRNTFSEEVIRDADIVISGAGAPHLIKPDMLKEGVVLIDAGTSESNGAIAGDADPACADVASIFTPVPGGMGPIAVACLFKNAAALALRNR